MNTTIFKSINVKIDNLVIEKESQEYSACEFQANEKRIKFRSAKITPTKIGQFVTIWKREGDGPIMPFDTADPVDVFMIVAKSDDKLGLFIFPQSILHQKGYVSHNGIGGKRAMRVYPSWDIADNPQAKKTQEWQLKYFTQVNTDGFIDKDKIQNLLAF